MGNFPHKDYFLKYGLTSERLKNAKEDVLVMHPGPINRDVEIESSLADDVNKSVINEQVENGVAIRMACLAILLNYMIFEILIIILFSYIIGSIPFGVILAKFFSLDDIRTIGSGNTGATNVLRTGNYTAAALTLILDFSKAGKN